MKIQMATAFLIAGTLFKVIGLDMGVLSYMIKNYPDPLQGIWGHAPKCIGLSTVFFIACLLTSSLVKYVFYHIVGMIYGMSPCTAMDDFW